MAKKQTAVIFNQIFRHLQIEIEIDRKVRKISGIKQRGIAYANNAGQRRHVGDLLDCRKKSSHPLPSARTNWQERPLKDIKRIDTSGSGKLLQLLQAQRLELRVDIKAALHLPLSTRAAMLAPAYWEQILS